MKCASSRTWPCSGRFSREPGEICKHRLDQVAVMGVGRRQAGGIQIEHVTRLGHRLGPRSGWHGQDLDFDNALLVDRKSTRPGSRFRQRLACHATVLRWPPPRQSRDGYRWLSARPCRDVCRARSGYQSCGALASMRCASDRSIELIEIISIAERCGGAPGTMIMVATRRKQGNERLRSSPRR